MPVRLEEDGESSMHSFEVKRLLIALALVGLLCTMSGCDTPIGLVGVRPVLWPSALPIAFGLGAWTASQIETTTVERRCYQDGVEVDCFELASPLE